jgi:nucleotide-binding universal stress UspA family protein
MKQQMRLLIAYDGSACSKEALNDLSRAALPAQCDALVVSVCDAGLPPDVEPAADVAGGAQALVIARKIETMVEESRSRALKAVDETRQLVDDAIEHLAINFPGWQMHGQAMIGDPSLAIIKEAVEWNVDLIIVGTHARSAFGRLMLGSVSQEVARAAACSVRIAHRPAERQDVPIRIVIGLDGPQVQTILEKVARRRWPAGSGALIVALDQPTESREGKTELTVPQLVASAEEDLRAAAGLHVSTTFATGEPEKSLIAEAKRFDADCIFIGASADDGDDVWRLGTLSSALLNGAPCSVEVVRQGRAG